MGKFAAYLRVSTDDQRERQSILSQEDALRRWFATQGIDAERDIIWYRDDGVSGATSVAERPAGGQLLRDVKAGVVTGTVFTFSLSRIARDAAEFFAFRRALEERGVALLGVSEGVDTTAEGGNLTAGIHALMAEEQRRSTMRASRSGMLRRAHEGKWIARTPYGYRIGDDGKLQPLEGGPADVVREIFAWYTEERIHAPTIAHRLNARGVPSPGGSRWRVNIILRILHNLAYAGEGVWNVAEIKGGRRTGRKRPASEHITIPVPPLVSRATWELAQAILKQAAKDNRKTGRSLGLVMLGGIVRCAECGRRYYRDARKNGHSYYRHDAYHMEDRRGCTNKRIVPAPPVDEVVWGAVLAAVRNPAAWRESLAERRAAQVERDLLPRIASLERALGEVEAALTRLEYAALVLGQLPMDRYVALSQEQYARREALQAELGELRRQEAEKERRAGMDDGLAEAMAELRATAEAADMATKTAICRRLIAVVRVRQEGRGPVEVEIDWL